MRLEIQLKSGPLPWAKKEQTSTLIDLQEIHGDYMGSKMREVTVPGQQPRFPTNQLISDREAQRSLSLENIGTLWNCDSLQNLLFVSLQLPIIAANIILIFA